MARASGLAALAAVALAAVALAAVALVAAAVAADSPAPADRLDVPALRTPLATTSPLTAVAVAGPLAVAVGPRGHVLRSEDGGASWVQASVPVSSDLTAVHLSAGGRGIAVGHDGVVLATEDGGRTWARRLDGRDVAAMLRARHPGCDGGAAGEGLRVACAQGAAVSFLDVWLDEGGRGLAVGAFGLVLATGDGGRTWAPWLDRSENPRALHLYAVRPAGGALLVAGEQGLLLRLDRARGRLARVPLRHAASLFGLVGRGPVVVAFGLAGQALRSADGGASWEAAETGTDAALVGGAVLPDGRLVLATQRGDLLASADAGRSFRPVPAGHGPPAAALAAAGPDAVLVAGATGARRVPIPGGW